jgi:cell division protein FtsB
MNRRRRNEKIIHMAEAQSKRKEKRARGKFPRSARRGNRVFAYRKFYIAALLCLLVMASSYAVRIAALKADEAQATAELEAASEQKARLENELAHIDDPAYIEQQARTRLRMVKPGELYYVLPARDGAESGAEVENGEKKDEKAGAE